MSRVRALALAAVLAGSLLASPGARGVLPAQPALAAGGGWTTYHLDNTRNGNDSTEPAYMVHSAGGDWTFAPTTTQDDEVFASPLVYGGHVFVATEANVVYAVDEVTGAASWSKQVAPPVPGNGTYIGCSPGQFGATDGITGTPVIDGAAGIIYVVAMTPTAAAGHLSEFVLYGLRLSDGGVVLTTQLAFTGLDPKYQNERAALGLANGYVYVIFGGRDGDCGSYHPWIVAAPTAGGAPLSFQPQTGGMNGAGMWAPSGMSIDAAGNIYVETGNGFQSNCSNTWDYGDGVLKLSKTLSLLSFFRPTDWCTLNGTDADMGSVGPLLLSNGQVFASGKSGDAWLLDSANLGGQGGQQFTAHVGNCNTIDAVFGGFAYDAARVYVPCDGHGLVALNVDTSAHTFATAWDATNSGYSSSPGAPILAGGVLWVEDQFGGIVHGFDPATGAARFTLSIGGAHRFTTLAADGGGLFAMVNHGVQKFQFSTFTATNTTYLSWFDRNSDPGFLGDDVHVVNPGTTSVFVNVRIPGQPACNYFGDTILAGRSKYYTCATGFGGPVVVESSSRVIASQRVQYNQSFNEVPAIPKTNAVTDLYLAWYDRISAPEFVQDNIHVVNPGADTANVSVTIPGYPACATGGPVAPGAVGVFKCDSGFGGPVHIHADQPVLASARVKYAATFNEVPAQPGATAMRAVSPWYDHASSTQFQADNVHVWVTSGTLTTAQVTSVSIPSCPSPTATQVSAAELVYACPFGQGFGGPMVVQATVAILVSQRVQYGSSFNESPAQAPSAAGTSLWMPWYDHASSSGFLADNVHVIAATAAALAPAQVTVAIPACSPIISQASASELIYSCPFGSGFGGPVQVTTTVAGGVMVSQRVQFYQSFNEVNAST
jgi:hypothetical protein